MMETTRSGRELWLSLVAILFITMLYLFVMTIQGGFPGAGSTFGEALGALGFVLMLLTETLYSLRKRSRSARWGRIASWFELHIFTGLVGPYMVLLHSSWKFNGLAGVVTLLMIIVVISGFGGRFIYTAVPRTADGVVLDAEQIESQIAGIEAQLQAWLAAHPASSGEIPRRIGSHPEARSRGAGKVLSQPFRFGREKLAWWRAIRHMGAREKAQLRQLERLVDQRDRLRRQLGSLASMRKLLSYWHVFHIPIGLGLFFLAFLHAGTAIYFTILAK
jgi:hypothetical protein